MSRYPLMKFSGRLIITLIFAGLSFPAFSEITLNTKKGLVESAIQAQKMAYAPYSNYFVGAAFLTKQGETIQASNVENASYGLTSCAERNAIFKAVTDGKKDFIAVAVVTKDGGFPCGACRQVLNEFSPNILVIVANLQGKIINERKLNELLPDAFGPQNLQK